MSLQRFLNKTFRCRRKPLTVLQVCYGFGTIIDLSQFAAEDRALIKSEFKGTCYAAVANGFLRDRLTSREWLEERFRAIGFEPRFETISGDPYAQDVRARFARAIKESQLAEAERQRALVEQITQRREPQKQKRSEIA